MKRVARVPEPREETARRPAPMARPMPSPASAFSSGAGGLWEVERGSGNAARAEAARTGAEADQDAAELPSSADLYEAARLALERRPEAQEPGRPGPASAYDSVIAIANRPNAGPGAANPSLAASGGLGGQATFEAREPAERAGALRPDVRRQLEQSFGEDFSGVEVSEGLDASAPPGEVDAVSEPERIRFAAGKLDQDSKKGRALIGEEFAHVVQKRRGAVKPDEVDVAAAGRDLHPSGTAQDLAPERGDDTPDAHASGDVAQETRAEAPAPDVGAPAASVSSDSDASDLSVSPGAPSVAAPAPAGARGQGAEAGAPGLNERATAEPGAAAPPGGATGDTSSLGSVVESFVAGAPAVAERAGAEIDTRAAMGPPEGAEGAETLAAGAGGDAAHRDEAASGEPPSDTASGSVQAARPSTPREQLEEEARRAGERVAHGEPASIASGARAPVRQYGIGDWLASKARQVGRGLRSVGSGVADFGAAAWDKIDGARRAVGRFRTTVKNGIASGWNSFTAGLGQGWSWVEGKFDSGLDWMRRNGGPIGRVAAGYFDFMRDLDKGLLKGAWSAVEGLGTMAYHAGELVNPFEWIFNPENNVGRLETLYSIGSALTTREGWAALWNGIKQPYVDAWRRGDYGEAIGMGLFEILSVVFGSKGLDKLGKASKLSKAAKIGSAAGKLGTGARLMGKLSAGLNRLVSGLQRGFGALRGSLSRLPQKLSGTARAALGGLRRKLTGAAGRLTQKAGSMFSRASQAIRARVGAMIAKARSRLSALLARNPAQPLIDGARRFLRSLPGMLRGLVGKLEGALSRLALGIRAIAEGVQRRLGQVASRGRAMLANVQQRTQRALARARGWVNARLAGARQTLALAQQKVVQAAQWVKGRVLGGLQKLTDGVRQRVASVRQRLQEGWNRWRKGADDAGDLGTAGKAAKVEVIAEQTTQIGELAHKLQAVRIAGRVQLWICTDCGSIVAKIDEMLAVISSKGPQKTLHTRLQKLRSKLVTLEDDIGKGAVTFHEIPAKLNQIGAHLRDLSARFPDVKELQFFRTFRATLDFEGLAARLGFRRTNFRSHGQPVFYNGQYYITPDVDSHIGGVWKMADSVRNLGSRRTRMGTYDANLNWIGD